MKKNDFQALVRYINKLCKPLNPEELIRQAIEDGIIDPKGRSASRYLEAEWPYILKRINEQVDDAKRSGGRPKIEYLAGIDRIVPGCFVTKTETKQPKELKEAITIRLCEPMLNKIYSELDDYQFQEFCTRFLELLGCVDCEVRPKGPDRGIDFSGTFHTPFSKIFVIGQAKHYTKGNTVSISEVKNLYATVNQEKGLRAEAALYLGVFVTTSTFSSRATKFANTADPPVYLVNGNQLAKELISGDIGIDYSDLVDIKLDGRNTLEWFR